MTTFFGREPAVILEFVKALLIVVAVTLVPISADVQAGILAALIAVFGVLKGLTTRPIAPTVFTDLITAIAALLLSFGIDLGPERVAAFVTLASAAVVLIQRAQITPVQTPALNQGGYFSWKVLAPRDDHQFSYQWPTARRTVRKGRR